MLTIILSNILISFFILIVQFAQQFLELSCNTSFQECCVTTVITSANETTFSKDCSIINFEKWVSCLS